MRITLALVAAFFLPVPASAVNKCIGADGRAVFQDMPCADGRGGKVEVKPASGEAPVAPAAPAAGAGQGVSASQAEVDRLQAQTDNLRVMSRILSLESSVIPGAWGRLNSSKAQCDAEFKALRARKAQANNNLAGATLEQAISSEMAAVATRCDTQSRALTEDLARFRKELADLKSGAVRP